MPVNPNDGPGPWVFALFAVAFALLFMSAVHWGSRAIRRWRSAFAERTRGQAREFFVFIDPHRLFAGQLLLMVLAGAAAGGISGSVWLAGAAVALSFWAPGHLYRVLRRRRLRRFDEQLPDALLLLAGALRAGVALPTALQQVVAQAAGPLGQEFSLLLREQRVGVGFDQALTELGRRVPTDSALLLVSGLRIASETGGALAETLDRISGTVRCRLQMEGKIDALTSQGRLQAWVVGALPLVLIGVLHHMEPQAMAMLWSTPAGWAVLGLIGFLLTLGFWMIRRIVAIDV